MRLAFVIHSCETPFVNGQICKRIYMKNLFDESEIGVPEPAFMADKTETKRNAVTFELDDDLVEGLASLLSAMGNAHGQKTRIMNDALRIAMPTLAQRQISALTKLTKGKKAA
jgi:hypothetical protein